MAEEHDKPLKDKKKYSLEDIVRLADNAYGFTGKVDVAELEAELADLRNSKDIIKWLRLFLWFLFGERQAMGSLRREDEED